MSETEPAPSFWLQQAEPLPVRPSLPGDMAVDVCIVGAGYTGLWTAYYLLKAAPGLSVAVVEQRHVGFGASGRNGGWVSAKVAGLDRLMKDRRTRGPAQAMQHEMHRTVIEIGEVVAAGGFDCGFVHGGSLLAATGTAQARHLRDYIAAKHAAGLTEDDHRWLEPDEAAERIRPAELHGATFTPHCAAVDPAALVLGLAEAAERAGAVIYENTPGTLDEGSVSTPFGRITAGTVVDAREAYRLNDHRSGRVMIPVYSLMVMTEPIDDAVWQQIGLAERETFSDGRNMIVYGQRTSDGRIAFGGRGAPYHYGSSIKDAFDHDEATLTRLRSALEAMFPQLSGIGYDGAWGGPLGIPRDWRPSVTLDRERRLARAGGYVGQGVAVANLAGRTLTDLILERDSALLEFPWVGHRSRKWEPEPLRWVGVNLGRKLTESIDKAEDREKRPRLRQAILDLLPVG